MILSIKREILSQLKKIQGLNFGQKCSIPIKVLPSILASNQTTIGKTFFIDLPLNADPNLIKFIKNSNLDLIENVQIQPIPDSPNSRLLFEVNFEFLVKELFKDLKQNLSFFFTSDKEIKKKIIVEYSSPNIAKPFHVGNLRSTIIGNSIANILHYKGHQVLRLNYIGDWGTQFGILSLAYDHFGDEEKLKSEPLKHLFDVYVKGNQECKNNENWRDLAKERFHKLELKKESKTTKQWNRFREVSLIELRQLYERLGIRFDEYSSESMYSASSQQIIQMLKKMDLIEMVDGALYAKITHHNDQQPIRVPLLKKDGTSLYLTRDIAAVLDRKHQYNFDKMYYVVDSSQAKHFHHLKSIFCSLEDPVYKNIEHIKFGRIIGMSTRKGDVIFLDDVLNEAQKRALESIESSRNTKIPPELYSSVADILGVASIIVHDLANRRVKEFKWNWNRALKMNGNTGISLQYTHARLCNLIKNSSQEFDSDCDNNLNVSAICTDEGRNLINMLLMFDEMIDNSYDHLEPSIITNYLFDLKTAINRANQELTVKGQSMDILQTRLILFTCARNVLNQCMQLIGLNPLQSM